MPNYICKTCGTQFATSATPPPRCPICEDERQYVSWNGQQWTTLDDLRRNYRSVFRSKEPGLTGIGMEPAFAIGQRALLIQHHNGNVLWDCISLLDDEIVRTVRGMGGISAIAISHPHYYSSMVEWSAAFNAPIYLHAADHEHVMRPDDRIVFWDGDVHPLRDGVTLIRCGGHFAGGTVLHWSAGAGGRGALLAGDIIMVVNDRRYVSFMYSYPNLIPLSTNQVRQVTTAVAPYAFDRIYSAWWDKTVERGAKAALARSVERYINAITD